LEDEKIHKAFKTKQYKNCCDARCKYCKKARTELRDLEVEMKNREDAIFLKYKKLHRLQKIHR
jgi:hypothetical protein